MIQNNVITTQLNPSLMILSCSPAAVRYPQVRLVDEGRVLTVPCSDLRALPPHLAAAPHLAITCRLAGIDARSPVSEGGDSWPPEVLYYFDGQWSAGARQTGCSGIYLFF